MTKDEFQQWWYAYNQDLIEAAGHELEALSCPTGEVDVGIGILLGKLEEYLQRICGRLEGDPWYLIRASIRRRARNHMRNSIRRHGLHHDVPIEQAEDVPSPIVEHDTIEQQHVRLVLAAMTLKDRDLLLGMFVEGYTLEELSKQMGYAQRTGAQAAINRAKARFRVIWYQRGYGGDIPQIAVSGNRPLGDAA